MDTTQLVAQSILETDQPDDLALEFDRLMLRLFTAPQLVSCYSRCGVKDGKYELEFHDMPEDGIQAVKSLLAVPDVEVFKYQVNGNPRVGFRFDLKTLVRKSPQ